MWVPSTLLWKAPYLWFLAWLRQLSNWSFPRHGDVKLLSTGKLITPKQTLQMLKQNKTNPNKQNRTKSQPLFCKIKEMENFDKVEQITRPILFSTEVYFSGWRCLISGHLTQSKLQISRTFILKWVKTCSRIFKTTKKFRITINGSFPFLNSLVLWFHWNAWGWL